MADRNNVVQFRRKSEAPKETDHFTLIGYPDNWCLCGPFEDRPWTAAELREIANTLREIAREMRAQADVTEGIPRREVVGDIQLVDDGTVSFWLSNRIQTGAQLDWVNELLESAKTAHPRLSSDALNPTKEGQDV